MSATPNIPKGYLLLGEVAFATRTQASNHLKTIKENWDKRLCMPPAEIMFEAAKIVQRKGEFFVIDLIPDSVYHENKN